MRLDSNKGDKGFTTYHAERCQVLRDVVWVDDEARCWAQYVRPFEAVNGVLRTKVHAAKRILILLERKLIVINPVGLGDRWDSRGDVLVTHKAPKPALQIRRRVANLQG